MDFFRFRDTIIWFRTTNRQPPSAFGIRSVRGLQQSTKDGGRILGQILREHRGFGRQIFLLAKNELIKTYKAALLGPLWAVIKPLTTLLVFWFAFDIGIRGGTNVVAGYPRFVFMLTAFVPWFFMSDAITGGAKAIRTNSQFVTKITFPVSAIITFTMLSKLYIHLMLCALMYLYLVIAGYMPSVYNLQFFLYCPLMFAFFTALAWSTAPMSSFSRDFENLIASSITALMWMSGIMWDSYSLDIPWLKTLMLWNPINFFANGYRKAFLYHQWVTQQPEELYIFLAELALIVVLGAWNYQRLRTRLPDIL